MSFLPACLCRCKYQATRGPTLPPTIGTDFNKKLPQQRGFINNYLRKLQKARIETSSIVSQYNVGTYQNEEEEENASFILFRTFYFRLAVVFFSFSPLLSNRRTKYEEEEEEKCWKKNKVADSLSSGCVSCSVTSFII